MNRCLVRKLLAVVATILVLPWPASAQTAGVTAKSSVLTMDSIMRGPGLTGHQPRNVRWSADSRRLFFEWKQAVDPLEKDFDTWVVERDGSGLRKLSEEEAKDAPPVRGDESRDHKRLVYADQGDVFLYESSQGKRRNLTKTTETESNPRFTRDERSVTFVQANNLFLLSLGDGTVAQLTNIVPAEDKGPNVTMWEEKKGTDSQEFLKKEERELLDVVARRTKKREEDEAKRKRENPQKPFKLEKKQSVRDLQLTPDGKYVLAMVTVENEKAKKAIVPNYVTESAYTDAIPAREKVGDALPVNRLARIDLSNGEVKWFAHGLEPPPAEEKTGATEAEKNAVAPPEKKDEGGAQRTEKSESLQSDTAVVRERELSLGDLVWSEDRSKAVLNVRSTDNKDRWIMAFDPAEARGRVLATMHDDAWIGGPGTSILGWLADNSTIYYISEQTGFAHLNTVSYSGGSTRALTSGRWEVTDVDLSDDRKTFYLTTSETTPYERHLYRLPTSGGERIRLTLMSGNNQALVSPDEAIAANVYSYTNKPPELYLQKVRRGGTPIKITSSPASEFWSQAWLDVPIVTIRARDGVDLPARIYKPKDYLRGGPAVIFVHGAGYLQNVHHWWSSYSREYMFHHILMERGYLVLDVDYRASSGYGRDWRTAVYRHMGGKDLDDQIDAARWLVREHGVDPKRLGIYGGSYGGFITLMALFTQPGVFAAGAALRPVTDWAHYNHPYTANILNTPQADAEAYRRSSPIYHAEGLQGALLICHGMIDVNVHFQDTVRLVQRLIELRKENWEVAPYPVEDHAFVEPTSWADEYKRILKLFEENLRARP